MEGEVGGSVGDGRAWRRRLGEGTLGESGQKPLSHHLVSVVRVTLSTRRKQWDGQIDLRPRWRRREAIKI